jgi:two-component system chemotaxis response regulator CheB
VSRSRVEAVVIGASAGAVEALSAIIPKLPAGYPLAVIVVVHVPPDRSSVMASLLQDKSRLRVKEAEDKEPIEFGTVYLAPPDYHVLVEPNFRLSLSSDVPVLFSRPSIDVLFESAADAYGDRLLGMVLSGANQDGASGLRSIVDSGGMAVVQNPATSYVAVMPQAALDACPEALMLDLNDIPEFLNKIAAREGA